MVDFPRTLASDGLPAHTGRSTVLRYGIAIGSVGLALLARAAIAPLLGDKLPFIWFLVAVAAAAWFGGSGPSRLSMALGFMAAEVFFIRHDRAWWIVRLPDLAVALSYFASASIIVLMTRAAHRNREQAIARHLRDAHAGDIRKRDLVKLEEADAEEQGGHAFRVMDAYVKALDGSES